MFSNRARAKEARRCTARSGLFSAMARSRRSAAGDMLLAGVLPIRVIFGILRVVASETLDGPVGFLGLPAEVHHPEQGVDGRGVVGGRLGQLHHAGDILLRIGPRLDGFLCVRRRSSP